MKNLFFIILLFATRAEAQTSALTISDSLYAVGSYSEAIESLKNISPKTEAVYLKMANAYREKGNFEKAIEIYKIVLEKNPNRVLTAVNLGEVLIKAGKFTRADSLFSTLAENYPKSAIFQYQLGLVKEQQQDSTAVNYFRKTIALDRTHQNALFRLAKNALTQSKYKTAEELSLRGLKANPNNVSLISILAQTYFNQKLYKLSAAQFEKLLALGQSSEFVHSKLGMAYFREGKIEKAIEQYKKALDFEPENSGTHYILGLLYVRTGDYKKSEKHLLRSILIKNKPVDAEYLSLALTYKEMKEYKLALDFLELALEENPDNERALYERANAGDNYFADLQTRMNYYQTYLNKYEETGNPDLIYLTKRRIKDIKEELHMKE